MASLQVGDVIRSVGDGGVWAWEPVLGFLHRTFPGASSSGSMQLEVGAPATLYYLAVNTSHGAPLCLTPDHHVFTVTELDLEEATTAGVPVPFEKATPVQARQLVAGALLWTLLPGSAREPEDSDAQQLGPQAALAFRLTRVTSIQEVARFGE